MASVMACGFLFFGMVMGAMPTPGMAQGSYDENATQLPDARDEVAQGCVRPYPPQVEIYQTRADYLAAREVYYVQASAYVSSCIGRWVEEARERYQLMFREEAEAYMRERAEVLREMREATATNFNR